VQELLRHASSRTTMDIYSHVSAAQQRDAVDALERMVRDDQSRSQSRVLEAGGLSVERSDPKGFLTGGLAPAVVSEFRT
jgi:hypothetical protein